MAEQGLRIVANGNVAHLVGALNEFAELSPLLKLPDPLRLNLREVSRLNSIGIRNFLKFLNDWGARGISYEECQSEFIDQINMIPALLGTRAHGKVVSLFVPYECEACEHEQEYLCGVGEFDAVKAGGEPPTRSCPKCQGRMTVLSDSYFVFLTR